MASHKRPGNSKQKLAKGAGSLAGESMQNATAHLLDSGIRARALKAGDLAQEFALRDASGNRIRLSRLLLAGPLVLSFYPGDWCRYCMHELDALIVCHPDIGKLGAQLVAVSPRVPARRATTKGGGNHSFPLLIDRGSEVAQAFGIACVCATNGLVQIPATYLINREGRIVFSFVGADHAGRVAPAEILTVLRSLRNRAALDRSGMAQR
jgi:peroxiredoxin